MSELQRRLYRILLKSVVKSRPTGDTKLFVVDPLVSSQFGSGNTRVIGPSILDKIYAWSGASNLDLKYVADWVATLKQKDDGDPAKKYDHYITRDDLFRLVKMEFRNGTTEEAKMARHVAKGASVIRKLVNASDSTTVTHQNGVRIELSAVRKSGSGASSAASHFGFIQESFFLYRLRIQNTSKTNQKGVKILGRHWIFRNSLGEEDNSIEKWSEGVVGLTPTIGRISKDEIFEYTSGTDISTKHGSMEGALLFEDLDTSKTFEVPISKTQLLSLS